MPVERGVGCAATITPVPPQLSSAWVVSGALCEVCASRHEHYCERGYVPSVGAVSLDEPCHHHAFEPARGICAGCHQPICVRCGALVDGQLACPDCRQSAVAPGESEPRQPYSVGLRALGVAGAAGPWPAARSRGAPRRRGGRSPGQRECPGWHARLPGPAGSRPAALRPDRGWRLPGRVAAAQSDFPESGRLRVLGERLSRLGR